MKILFLVVMFIPLLSASFSAMAAPRLTIYDDGRSCPANCDSHVVMHRGLNGTIYAHQPDSADAAPLPCVLNTTCEICFDDAAAECLLTTYRGTGPGENTFDLTPAFYEEWCAKENLPGALEKQCQQLQQTERKLDGRVNCINNSQIEACIELMEAATTSKADDQPRYDECKRVGQTAYNDGRPDSEKRAHGCAYEYQSSGGPNSNGLTWKKLLPGACREGTFVGRDGLDCCSGVKFADAALGFECKIFYPRENE